MSTLTNTQINQTYQGLLKLANSSTGLTNTLQVIEDGLGNSTNMRIATGQLEVSNIQSFINIKADYYGSGFSSSAPSANSAGIQNIILAMPFYDKGLYSYSALSCTVVTATTTSDTVEAAIYTSQFIPGNGYYPHAPIISGITASTTTTGVKTFTFPSNITMSGYGGGIYWLVWKITSSGTPTVRFGGSPTLVNLGNASTASLGFTTALGTPTSILNPWKLNGNNMVLSGQTTFDNPFSNTLNTTQSTTASIQTNGFGFALHTV